MANVDIANQALYRVGANKITTLAELTTSAEVCNALLEPTRDEVLRVFAWNCAIKRASLTGSASSVTDFPYKSTLPTDCLRVLEVNEESGDFYRIEGDLLYTVENDPSVRYVCKLTDPDDWDPVLVQAVVARLAYRIAIRLTADLNIASLMNQEFIQALTMAAQISAIEDKEDFAKLITLFQGAGLGDQYVAEGS